jgi:hypothetical protein
MTDITKTISHVIESQFPAYYREQGAELVAFIKAYYEFLESSNKYSTKLSRQMFELKDIDDSLNSFLSHFQNEFLADFPSIITSNRRFAIKHILDLYSTKGSKYSLELLMKLLYNEEIDVYYPGDDVLKPSDSLWYQPIYVEVTKSPRTRTFLDKQITGSISGAKGFVESVITKRVNGKLIDIVYLSSVQGQFRYGERITDNNSLNGAPTINGSLTSINIVSGGQNNNVGDILDVLSNQAKGGKVRVTGIENATGRVNFNLVDGGYGYTTTNSTSVYVSTAILNVNNANLSYSLYEPVLQRIEKVYLADATNINSANVGDYLSGRNAANTVVANSIIISVANTNSTGNVISEASANSLVTVQLIGDTTFSDQKKLTLSSATAYSVGELIDEQSTVTLTVSSNTGFNVNDAVSQTIREPVNDTITSRAFGLVESSNTTTIVVKEAWGNFATTQSLIKTSDPTVNCSISVVNVSNTGARGLVTNVIGSDVSVRVVYGAFDNGNKIRGDRTKLIATISSTATTGAANVYLNGNNNANGIIGAPAGANNVTKVYANGIIVGQNTTAIGIYGNTQPFFYTNTVNFYIETNRELLISPPRYPNGSIIELNTVITGIKTGEDATFDVGVLENTEIVALNTDIIGANNTANTPFLNVLLNGQNSGIGFVASVTVNSGGTSYANNSQVIFTGGGRAGGEPWLQANAYITTNGSGVITTITVTNFGEGYYTSPTLTLPVTSGTVASVSPVINYGYGFIKNPQGEYTDTITSLLTAENFTIGSIGSLDRINPGLNYNADPFTRVYNPYIAGFARGDFYLELDNIIGSFIVGENLEQSNSAKGVVLEYNFDKKLLKVRRTSFNVAFSSGIVINGVDSNARATIIDIQADSSSRVLGDNAIVSSNVIVANGIATSVEVVDSGFGYTQNGVVTLKSTNNQFIIEGTANVLNQGVGEGYWKTTTSHLNSEKKIHDNNYYQEYSYDIISGLSINRYRNRVIKILHVAGNELFGSVEKRSTANLSIDIANSSITDFEAITDYMLVNDSNLLINDNTLIVSTENMLETTTGYILVNDSNLLINNDNLIVRYELAIP